MAKVNYEYRFQTTLPAQEIIDRFHEVMLKRTAMGGLKTPIIEEDGVETRDLARKPDVRLRADMPHGSVWTHAYLKIWASGDLNEVELSSTKGGSPASRSFAKKRCQQLAAELERSQQERQQSQDTERDREKVIDLGADAGAGSNGDAPSREVESPIVLLEDLARLNDAGVLTDDEFAMKKAEILSRL